MKDHDSPETTRVVLQVLSLGLLMAGALWVLEPFVISMIWAGVICITTWPLLLAIQRRMWNRRYLAVTILIATLFLVVIVPCFFAVGTIVSSADKLTAWAKAVHTAHLPQPPSFLARIPLFGPHVMDAWQRTAALSTEMLSQKLAPYTSAILGWFISKTGSLAILIFQFLLTLIFCAVLYVNGPSVAVTIRALAARLAGEQGESAVILAAKAVRSVALGVVLTALVQATLSGIGLAVAGVPSAMLLTAITFVLCLAQIGPALVIVPAICWLFWRDEVFSGSVLIAFAVLILPLDNIMRPILIRKGADMPLILVFIGVIGGMFAMGVIGLFIGPVILAVVHTLLKAWIASKPTPVENTELNSQLVS